MYFVSFFYTVKCINVGYVHEVEGDVEAFEHNCKPVSLYVLRIKDFITETEFVLCRTAMLAHAYACTHTLWWTV